MMDGIRTERSARLMTVTLCEQPLNILGRRHILALNELLGELAADRDTDVLWLRAEDTRAFCAGVAIEDHLPDVAADMLDAFRRLGEAFLRLPQVVVAEVYGAALGGGFELVLLSDLVVAADDVKFGLPEVTLAATPPIGAALLPLRIGWQEAARVCLLGQTVDGAWAERRGLVAELVPRAQLHDAAQAVVTRLLGMSGAALRTTKQILGSGAPATEAAMQSGFAIYVRDLLPSHDSREGIEAFVARRPPIWTHR